MCVNLLHRARHAKAARTESSYSLLSHQSHPFHQVTNLQSTPPHISPAHVMSVLTRLIIRRRRRLKKNRAAGGICQGNCRNLLELANVRGLKARILGWALIHSDPPGHALGSQGLIPTNSACIIHVYTHTYACTNTEKYPYTYNHIYTYT